MYKKADFDFHQTFQPQLDYVSDILKLAIEEVSGTKEEYSNLTGIPTGKSKGKVIPHIMYAYYMGLVRYLKKDGAFSLQTTDLGKHIFLRDPYLLTPVSRWLCHANLCSEAGAPQWNYLFNQFTYVCDEDFSISFAEKRFKEENGFAVDLKIVKNTYNSGCFETLRLLRETGNDRAVIRTQLYQPELEYVYAYILMHLWDIYFPGNRELTLEQIMGQTGFHTTFGFDRDEILDMMDELAADGLLRVNRQLSPVTVIRTSTEEEMLKQLY